MAKLFSDDELRALSASRERRELDKETELLRKEQAEAHAWHELENFVNNNWRTISDAIESYPAVAESCGKHPGRLLMPTSRFRVRRLSEPVYHLADNGIGPHQHLFVNRKGDLLAASTPNRDAACYNIDQIGIHSFVDILKFDLRYDAHSEKICIPGHDHGKLFSSYIIECLISPCSMHKPSISYEYITTFYYLVDGFVQNDSNAINALLKDYLIELAMQPWYGFSG